MKNLIKNISFIAALLVMLSACVENDPDYKDFPSKDVDFTYSVAPNADGEIEYALDYYVVSTIQFTNTSSKSGAITWDFGDGTTSTEANPTHKFSEAGTYQVKLTIDGVGSRTYPLMIYDITPVLSISSQSADVITVNDVMVDFNIFLPNPDNKKVKYVWDFPEGTVDEQGNAVTSFTGYSDEQGNVEYPGKLKFSNIGSQRITLHTTFDTEGENRVLDDSYVNVQVGADKEYKTVYFATIAGNVKALKLIPDSELPKGTKNLPFDMGVAAGMMPFNLVNDKAGNIYILDCGKQYTYLDDTDGNKGDGKISVMSYDGKSTNVFVTNVGLTCYNDPFFGCIDGGNLIYTDRNTGIRRMDLTLRGQVEKSDYLVQNNELGYYGRSIAYGAISTTILKDSKGMYYWGKCYNGEGIYRFKSTDIGKTDAAPYEVLLSSTRLKGFTIDEQRGALYVWRTKTDGGFYAYPLPAESAGLSRDGFDARVLMDADPINTSDAEGVYVTQLAVDEETGYVYFGFNKASTDSSTYPTGLKYYDPATKKIVNISVVTDKILGITINDTKSKLF